MRIAFNPSTVEALTTPPNNKDITFDLRGQNIFARGVKFCGTDTNTWRDIKINNVSIGSNTLDLRDSDNTTLTNINGVVTINSTWRPVVDNLTSDSTTSSLSANQGRVLKALIDGKSDSGHTHDDRYVKRSGDTMLGALNFANGTWNLVGDDSYMGDCNISGHFGIKAANTTYPGIAFFNNANNHLGNLIAYNGNITYGAYSLQFLDNGNTSVSASTWTNPFNDYNSNAVADGQAVCVWGQSSYLSNLANDTGDMSLWLKRVNANVATLNMVLDGEYYANGNQRLAHVSEIPTATNYYWANVKISDSSSTTTSPTVSNLTATSSIKMSNISLEHTDEINNSANGGLHLNYRNTGNITLCIGGGNVGISNRSPSYKLDVKGQMRSEGFHHYYADSNDYVLLAGGSYLIHKTGSTTWSTAIQFGNYVWIILQMDNVTSGRQVVPNNIAKPTKNIYVVNIQTGDYNNSRNGIYRIAPDGNLYHADGPEGQKLYTTICYVAS